MLNLLSLLSVSAVWSKVWPILVAILFFGLIITIHEIGHFVFAKLFKVKVNEFAIGMGPALFSFQRGETKYALRALPIGGFCAMEGEDEDSEDDNSFDKKKPWKRFIVIAAGAIFNLILGLFIVGALVGGEDAFSSTIVAQFYDDAVSSQHGLEVGDKITKVNGLRVYTTTDLSYAMTRGESTVYDFEVIRDGATLTLTGVEFATKEYNGTTTVYYDFAVLAIEKTSSGLIKNTFLETYSMVRLVRLSLTDLITGKYGLKDLSGPVGTMEIIAEAATEAASGSGAGISTILNIMAYITINIGIFNLLPIPALDGGRLVFIALEGIRRKPVLPKYEKYVHAAGLVALLTLMAIITLKDVIYLFK